jgi:hypothetical protein
MLSALISKLLLIFSSILLLVAYGCETPLQTTNNPNQTDPKPSEIDYRSTDVQLEKNELHDLKEKLVETYARYWPLISSEHQHEQLPSVIGDTMPELRVFAIERVGVLMRDGDASDEELQLVVDRLQDDNSTVRLAAAKLLPEIHVPGLAQHVANLLSLETNEQVVEQELIFFQTVSHPSAIIPTITRLEQNPSEQPAKALIFLLNNNEVSDKTKRQILSIVLKSKQKNIVPALITLEAMLGSNTTKQGLIILLDHQDDNIREAVAKGFGYAGFTDPLIERADDDLMYPYALDALQTKIDIDSFQKLLGLRKENNPNWEIATFNIASSLSTSDLLRADDMLKRLKLDDLRLSILDEVWKKASEKSLAARKAIARRTVPLMIDNGDAVSALQLLDAFGESLIDDDLITLRFVAAINASAWDAAADAKPEPTIWIAQWERIKDADPIAAAVIKKQIIQRFNDQLTQEQKLILEISEQVETVTN